MTESTSHHLTHRIRVAALVIREDHILLVKHEDPARGRVWWSPPGGGIEGRESIFECAEREAWEETNIVINATKVLYLQELIVSQLGRRNLELFVLGVDPAGILQEPRNVRPYTQEAQFFRRQELQSIAVFPEFLKDEFWDDLKNKFPGVRYLGITMM